MSTAITKIMDSLNTVFAPMDAEVLQNSQKWAEDRVHSLVAFRASDEFKELAKKGAFGGMYPKLFAVAGGKTWYDVFTTNGKTGIQEFVAKNCAATAKRRNASITNKLLKAGVTEVTSETYTHTNDGFNGVFYVVTDQGIKRVTIDTIRAGGYNVQCLHLRVLVKVSKV